MNSIDFDDLVDRNEIAHILGVGPTAVSNYVSRSNKDHPPFPEALITRSLGRFRLYEVVEVERWHRQTFPDRSTVWDDAATRLRQFRETYSADT